MTPAQKEAQFAMLRSIAETCPKTHLSPTVTLKQKDGLIAVKIKRDGRADGGTAGT